MSTYEIEKFVDNDSNDNELEVTFVVEVGGKYMPATFTDPEEHPETEIDGVWLKVELGDKSFNYSLSHESALYKALVKEHGDDVQEEAMAQFIDEKD